MSNLSPNTKFQSVLAELAAGTGVSQTSAVDMAGFSNVAFVVTAMVVAAGGSVTLSLEAREAAADPWRPLAGSLTRGAAGVLALEVQAPMFRFIRCVIVRADATLGPTLALSRLATQNPVVNDEQSTAVLVSPEPV